MSDLAGNSELDPELDLQSPILTELLQIWENARADKPLPARADMGPSVLGPVLLPHILIADVEYHPVMRFRWRLIGTHTTETLGRDVTGSYWDEIYNEQTMASLALRVGWLLKHRKPLRAIGISPKPEENAGSSETLYLPLSDDGSRINMVMLGSVYTVGPGA